MNRQSHKSNFVTLPDERVRNVAKFANRYRFSSMNMLRNVGAQKTNITYPAKVTVKRFNLRTQQYYVEGFEGLFDFSLMQFDAFDMKVAETGAEYSVEFDDDNFLVVKFPIGWGLIFFNTLRENLLNIAELIYQDSLFWPDWNSDAFTDFEKEQWGPQLVGLSEIPVQY